MMFGGLGLVILGIIGYLVWDKMQKEKEGAGEKRDRSIDILRERYARGEITKEQYDEMRKALEGR